MFSPGRLLGLCIVFTSTVCVANPAATSSRIRRFHQAEVTSLAWSSDGKTLASGDTNGVVVLSDVQTGRTRTRWQYKQEVTALAFSPDSQRLAVARGREVRLLNAKTGAPIRVFQLQDDASSNLAFSADGSKLMALAGKSDKPTGNFFVDVWQLPSGKPMRRWTYPLSESFAATLAPNGRAVAIGTMGHIELRSVVTGKDLGKWEYRADDWPYVLDLSWSSDGKCLAATGGYFEGPGHFDVWNMQEHRRIWGDTFHDWSPCIAFSPHNRLLAVGTTYETDYDDTKRPGNVVYLYDLKTHKLRSTLVGHKGDVNALAWSPDGKRLASGGDDKTVRVWTLAR